MSENHIKEMYKRQIIYGTAAVRGYAEMAIKCCQLTNNDGYRVSKGLLYLFDTQILSFLAIHQTDGNALCEKPLHISNLIKETGY